MFGGVGLYCDDIFFAVLDDDRCYFKVDDSNREAYEQAGMGQWTIEGPQGGPMPYRELPPSVLEDAQILGEWIDAAVRVALAKKKQSKRSSKK